MSVVREHNRSEKRSSQAPANTAGITDPPPKSHDEQQEGKGNQSPTESCATSCSCEDHSADMEINDGSSNNGNQNTPVVGIRSSVKVSDACKRKEDSPPDTGAGRSSGQPPLVKRVCRDERQESDRHNKKSPERDGRERPERDGRHLPFANDAAYEKHSRLQAEGKESRDERHEERPHRHHHRRQEKTSRLMLKDYPSLLKYFLSESIYFVIKSSNYENIQISMEKGVWSTPPQNEHKLSQAFQHYRNVILFFSAKESGRFAGFARLSSDLIPVHEAVNWILPPRLAGKKMFNGIFQVDWISRRELPFLLTSHLLNPLNDGKPVKIARDGQQIDPRIGAELVNLFPRDEEIQIIPLLKRMKKQAMNRIRKLDAVQHQHRQLDDQLHAAGADSKRSPLLHHRLRVVVHNHLHFSPRHATDGRRVHVPTSSSRSDQRRHGLHPVPRTDVRGLSLT